MKTYWAVGNYTEFKLTKRQIDMVSHSGDCEDDARQVIKEIRKQLDRLSPESIKNELWDYGAWDDVELRDHEMNLVRLVWTQGGQLADELVMKGAA
jgi:hypothetical protein